MHRRAQSQNLHVFIVRTILIRKEFRLLHLAIQRLVQLPFLELLSHRGEYLRNRQERRVQ